MLAALVAFAIFNTLFLVLNLSSAPGSYPWGVPGSQAPLDRLLSFFEAKSLIVAPTSWTLVGGLWVWRGRMRSKWMASGFESDIFQLFVRMKGGNTRIRLLSSLSSPKDRFQLAQELGLNWKAINYQVDLLQKHGFVKEWKAYGKVRMYEVTPTGKKLLELLKDLEAKRSE